MTTPLTEKTQMALYKRFRTLLSHLERTDNTIDGTIVTVGEDNLNIFEAIAVEFALTPTQVRSTILSRYYSSRAPFYYGYPYSPPISALDLGYIPLWDIHRGSIGNSQAHDSMAVSSSLVQAQMIGLSIIIVKMFPMLAANHVAYNIEAWIDSNEEELMLGTVPLLRQVVGTKKLYIAHQPVERPSRVIHLPKLTEHGTNHTAVDVGGLESAFVQAVTFLYKVQYGRNVTSQTTQIDAEEPHMLNDKRTFLKFVAEMASSDAA